MLLRAHLAVIAHAQGPWIALALVTAFSTLLLAPMTGVGSSVDEWARRFALAAGFLGPIVAGACAGAVTRVDRIHPILDSTPLAPGARLVARTLAVAAATCLITLGATLLAAAVAVASSGAGLAGPSLVSPALVALALPVLLLWSAVATTAAWAAGTLGAIAVPIAVLLGAAALRPVLPAGAATLIPFHLSVGSPLSPFFPDALVNTLGSTYTLAVALALTSAAALAADLAGDRGASRPAVARMTALVAMGLGSGVALLDGSQRLYADFTASELVAGRALPDRAHVYDRNGMTLGDSLAPRTFFWPESRPLPDWSAAREPVRVPPVVLDAALAREPEVAALVRPVQDLLARLQPHLDVPGRILVVPQVISLPVSGWSVSTNYVVEVSSEGLLVSERVLRSVTARALHGVALAVVQAECGKESWTTAAALAGLPERDRRWALALLGDLVGAYPEPVRRRLVVPDPLTRVALRASAVSARDAWREGLAEVFQRSSEASIERSSRVSRLARERVEAAFPEMTTMLYETWLVVTVGPETLLKACDE